MKRREFVTLIGGAAVWPFAARAQQKKTHRIGILSQDLQPGLLETFRDELRKRGYIEGTDISIELRNAEGHNERLPALAEELLKLKVDVIVAINTPAVQAAKKATGKVPVVMMRVADPVKSGLVASLARPGGNITGMTFLAGPEIASKQLELLREIAPTALRVAVLMNPRNGSHAAFAAELKTAARKLGAQLQPVRAESPHQLEDVFAAMAKERAAALLVLTDAMFLGQRQRIADFARRGGLPAMYSQREFVVAGGLISYGPSLIDMTRRAAKHVDSILRGARPNDVPVEQPTKFELIINTKAAEALGVTMPQSLLVRADEVIQ